MRQVSAALIGGRAEPDELTDWWIFFFFKPKDYFKGVVTPKYRQSSSDCQSGDPETQGGRGFHRLRHVQMIDRELFSPSSKDNVSQVHTNCTNNTQCNRLNNNIMANRKKKAWTASLSKSKCYYWRYEGMQLVPKSTHCCLCPPNITYGGKLAMKSGMNNTLVLS